MEAEVGREKLRKGDEDIYLQILIKGRVKEQKTSGNMTKCNYFTEFE